MKNFMRRIPYPDCPLLSPVDLINDPLGSYTGVLEDPTEKPVQDADDL
jgi:hypothetical protein